MASRRLAITSACGVVGAIAASNAAHWAGASPGLAWVAGAAAGGVALLIAARFYR